MNSYKKMKLYTYLIIIGIIGEILFLVNAEIIDIEFKDDTDNEFQLLNKLEHTFFAKYNRKANKNYLYIYTTTYGERLNDNKAIIKIYFKEIPNKDSANEYGLNYLNSTYSSIDFNSGLLIKLNRLIYDTAIIFVQSYETCKLKFWYKYTDNIEFPSYFKYTNYQLNQLVLENGEDAQPINFRVSSRQYNFYLIILSKTSLRNIEVTAKYNSNDVTKNLTYLYPNGLSFFMDKDNIKDTYVYLTIKNKSNKKEVILLGYNHQNMEEVFPNDIVNGFHFYLEGNKNELDNLKFSGKANSNQYFIYQIYNKRTEIDFLTSAGRRDGNKKLTEYNSVFPNTIDIEGRLRFEFKVSPQRNALYFQYIDYSDYEVAQKSLNSLVTGIPKAMIIPKKKSMYHFLPIERDSNNLYFYLRAKTEETIFVSFESCTSYPENCTFSGKKEYAVEAIKNVGLWYTLPRNKNEVQLQLIYVYCENDCAYDILMSYETDDPLFLFPENDYTKFISDSGTDIFSLPVFEFFETSGVKSLYIDLTVISGKATLTLKNGKDGAEIKYNLTKIGNRQSFIISSDIFLNDANYYKKEIYAFVKQDSSYKNTIYNIMYGTGQTQKSKFLTNKIINIESLKVGAKDKENINSKIFNFINNENRDLYISISTQICKSKVLINDNAQYESYSHSYKVASGSHNIEIYLLNDNNLCKEGFEEEVILFSYFSNQNVLIPENTFINGNISENVSFLHLFKPNENDNFDNSFNIGIERLNKNPISFSYELKRISFNGFDNSKSSDISSHKINAKKVRYISNKQIKNICGSLKQYEVCSLTMTFRPSSSNSLFYFHLNKNHLYVSKKLTERTLLNSANSKSVQYFYIDINENKNKNLELLINSYGDHLKYNFEVKNEKQEDNIVLPLKNEFHDCSNNLQTTIDQSYFSKCNEFCRLYIGVKAENSGEEVSSLFSIGYKFLDEENSFINIPLNYFTQYTFKDSTEVKFSLNPIEDDDFTFELYPIKQNENDDVEFIADISGPVSFRLTSSEGKSVKAGSAKEIQVKITKNKGNAQSTFKFRVSSIGNGNLFKGFIPMVSSYEEKCIGKSTCYYILDDFSLDNEGESAYFYIPEKESSVINIKELKYDEKFTNNDYEESSSDVMKRPNWYELSNINKEKDIIIKIGDNEKITLCPSYFNKPNKVTLNYGEKRIFTLRKEKLENIILNINQPSVQKSKVRINIHSIRGNGIFKFKEEVYPLGLENSYKEDISIIIDDYKLSNIILTAINEMNSDYEDDADFVFSIEYKIELFDQLLYEINYDKVNSYKFYRQEKINEALFYLNIARPTKDLNINIKIYSNSIQYDIKSYFVNNNFIQKRLNNSHSDSGLNATAEVIKTYIQGGNSINGVAFSKLEISSDKLQNNIKDYPYICIIFTPKGDQTNFTKFDLYPYEMNNTIPLARNQLFIQKIQPDNNIYKLFLSKSEIFYEKSVIIDYVPPLLKKYYYSINHYDNKNSNLNTSEKRIVDDIDDKFSKRKIILNSIINTTNKNILFNLFPNDNSKIEDSFIFSYKNQKLSEEKEIYQIKDKEYFNISGDSNEIEYIIGAPIPRNLGKTIFISRVFEYEKISHLDNKENINYLSLYLLFSDIKPKFEKYFVSSNFKIDEDNQVKIPDTLSEGGDFYFTAICIFEDNEREIYFGYKGIRKTIEDKNYLKKLLDYMKEHILATIIILIIILLILGMIINICRNERKVGRLSSVKVDVEGQLMEDKAD